MEINLFDSNFIGSDCSVAYQTPKHIAYVRDLMYFNGITIFTDEWINNPIVDIVQSTYKIGWLREPYCLHPGTYERSLDNLPKFDFILTYYKPFLNLHPRYKFAPYAGTWLNYQELSLTLSSLKKHANISLLSGDKLSTIGHKLRRQIADKYHDKVDMFGYRGQQVNYSQQTKIDTLRPYRYSIITETCREDNLFTEWLLDAFLLGTIPIYWGCSNLAKYFNVEGVLQFSNMAELDDIMRALEPMAASHYMNCLPAIRDNFNLAQEYAITEDWLYIEYFKGMV